MLARAHERKADIQAAFKNAQASRMTIYLIERVLSQLDRDPSSVSDIAMYSEASHVNKSAGVTIFEPRTARFEGPLGGEFLRIQNVDECPKEQPWSEWSNGGTLLEPECPSIAMVNPHTGESEIAFIGVADNGTIETDYAAKQLTRCLKRWIELINGKLQSRQTRLDSEVANAIHAVSAMSQKELAAIQKTENGRALLAAIQGIIAAVE